MSNKPNATTAFFSFLFSTLILCSNAFGGNATAVNSSTSAPAFNVTVVSGQASISQSGLVTDITQLAAGNLIAEGNLSTVTGEIVNITLLSASNNALLRDITGQPTFANGSYYSNGGLFLVNPQGFVFGPNSQVQAARIVASTLGISNNDFLTGSITGKFKFSGQGTYIINQGRLIPQPGGYVALLSGAIKNEGTIQAQLGSIVLASGDKMTLTTVALDDHDTIFVAIDKAVEDEIFGPDGKNLKNAIDNKGFISANGGTVTLTAKSLNTIFDHSINNSGIIEAKSLSSTTGGDVVLKAQGAGISSSGSLDASGVLKLLSQDPISSLGILQSSSLIERGASFQVAGLFNPGDANIKNADNAMTYSADADVSGTIQDAANIIIDPNVTLTMTGNTNFVAGDEFLMDPSATINGGGHSLSILAAGDAQVGNINNVSALTVTATGGYLDMAAPVTSNDGNISLTAGQDIIQESAINTNGGNYTAHAQNYILTGSPSITSGSGTDSIFAGTVAELGGSNTATTYAWSYLGGDRGYSLTEFGYYFLLGSTLVHVPSVSVGLSGNITNPVSGVQTFINVSGIGSYIVMNPTYTTTPNPSQLYYWYSNPVYNQDGGIHLELGAPNLSGLSYNTSDPVENWEDEPLSIADKDYNDVILQSIAHTSDALIITASDESKVFGAALPSLTVSYAGFVNGDTSANLTTQPTVNTTATSTSSVGEYSITASGAVDPNYTIFYVPGKLTVTPATVTVTLTVSGIGVTSKIYDGTTTAILDGSPVLNGVISGDDVILIGTPVGTYNSPDVTSANTVTVTGLSLGGTNASNYTLSPITIPATITPAPLIVTASNQVKTYGNSNLDTGAFTSSGLQNGETIGSVSLATNATTSSSGNYNAGTWSITPSAATGGTFAPSNYAISYAPGTLSVNPASLTISSLTAAPKAYDGTTNATLDGSPILSGVIPGDNVILTGTPIGTFNSPNVTSATTVVVTGLSLGGVDLSNYTIVQPTTIPGTITPAPLTVTASDQTKIYGDSNLDSSAFTSAGLKNSETIGSVGLTTNATTSSSGNYNAGTWSITPSAATGGTFTRSNYSISYAPGILTVNPATLSIIGLTVEPKTEDGTTSATIDGTPALSGVVPGDNVNPTGTPVGTFNSPNASSATTVTVTGLGLGGIDASDYVLSPTTIAATITPAGGNPNPSPQTAVFTLFDLLQTNDKVNKIIYETLHPYQLSSNVYEPLVFFYHPLTPIDQSSFNDISLDEGAYDFIDNSLDLKKLPPAYYGVQ